MDPRKAATVTEPSMVQAFQEGTGREPEPRRTDNLTVYVALFEVEPAEDVDLYPQAVRAFVLPAVQLGVALAEVSSWLSHGDGRAVSLQLGSREPAGWHQVGKAISAPGA